VPGGRPRQERCSKGHLLAKTARPRKKRNIRRDGTVHEYITRECQACATGRQREADRKAREVARGLASAIGATRTAKNGYHYTKVEERGWVLTHWLTIEAERGKLIDPDKESVRFRDGFNKHDYANPDAIVVIPKRTVSLRKKKAQLEARIQELQAELQYVESELARFE
jgi:hypothetical protein